MNRARRAINILAREQGLTDGWRGVRESEHKWFSVPQHHADYMNGFKQGREARAKKEAKELA